MALQDPTRKPSSNLGDFMSMMDIVDIKRRQASAIKEELGVDEQKRQLIEKLKGTYERMGTEVTDEQLEHAIESYFSKRWEFNPPSEGIKTNLASLYVNRGKITRRVIIPTVALASILGITVKVFQAASVARERAKEQSTEIAVEEAYNKRKSLEQEIELVASRKNELPSSEQDRFNANTSEGLAKLIDTDSFFKEYCPAGQADAEVTIENYPEVKKEMPKILSSINLAVNNLSSAKEFIEAQEKYSILVSRINNLLSKIKSQNPPKPLMDRATSLYESGESSIKNRQIREAERAEKSLSALSEDVSDFVTLQQRASQIYEVAHSEAKEEEAIRKLGDLYEQAKTSISQADVQSLRSKVEEITSIKDLLEQEYAIEVVNQRGIRSGLWRKSNENPPRNASDEDPEGKMFYIVVHAIDAEGQEVPLRLRNIEGGTVDTVKIWGERVPHEVYLRIKQDKIDNGLIDSSNTKLDNKNFAKKKKGYLTIHPSMSYNSGSPIPRDGQLTREENNWRSR